MWLLVYSTLPGRLLGGTCILLDTHKLQNLRPTAIVAPFRHPSKQMLCFGIDCSQSSRLLSQQNAGERCSHLDSLFVY